MMVQFSEHEEASAELDALFDEHPNQAAVIDAVLEMISESDELLDVMNRPHDYFDYVPPFQIKKYAQMQEIGCNVFILKIRDENDQLIKHRVLYGHDSQSNHYYVLAVADRDISYDVNDQLFQHIKRRYAECGIPNYRFN